MKVIDLLNKIANGEDVPKKIKFDWIYWKKVCGEKYTYYIDEDDSNDFFIYFFRKNLTFTLNDEIEIIEEDKKIEKMEIYNDRLYNQETKHFNQLTGWGCVIVNKINEIIDEVNKLKDDRK